jgi:hypothetical protein
MATILAADQPLLAAQPDYMSADQNDHDPFLSSSTSSHRRFSHFDNQLFALGPTTSPDQAKRALEAHLVETERRIQEASKLGTTLVQQRKELADRLKEVEKQQNEGDITPELRQKLVEIEKEYNDVERETARAFLPKSRVSSNEMSESPFAQKRSVSPSKFESQATNSPSKLTVPNRKQRNQPSNRVHDIEFATEISTSLLSQVRQLQSILAEKEDALRTVTLEKSRLEIEAEGFAQRLRSLDESEHRYKDENWNLETQIHEFLAAAKESASREQKLTQSLNIAQSEKSAAQKELDEIKLSHAKLSEEHAATIKHHEAELGGAKRTMTKAEGERALLQRKIEELTSQNQELAKAVAHQRGRLEDRDQQGGLSDDDFDTAQDNITPEHSPPPSPVKNTPRHSMLESETLRTSLNHALRMIQNLKGTIHREKTEKLQLNRLLQETRDELDARRSDIGSASTNRRSKKMDSREFKKPMRPAQLGGPRRSRDEIFVEDPSWEEEDGQASPTRAVGIAARSSPRHSTPGAFPASFSDATDQFETANEFETDAFETANERGTETEDFQTGVEEMSGSDELTETETGPAGKLRQKPPPLALLKPGNRESFQSTASLSGDEYSYEGFEEVKTPTASQPQRLRLKVSRGGNRRSRAVSEEPQFQSSPASFANSSRDGTPQPQGKSLFAELGDLNGSDDESIIDTPSRSAYASQVGSPPSRRGSSSRNTMVPFPPSPPPPVPKLPMVDSGMMTDSWEPEPVAAPESEPKTPQTAVPFLGGVVTGGLAGAGLAEAGHFFNDKGVSVGSQAAVQMSDATSQWQDDRISTGSQAGVQMTDATSQYQDERISTGSQAGRPMSDAAIQWHEDEQNNDFLKVESDRSRPISTSTYSDMSSQYDSALFEESLAKFPSPPMSRAETPMANLSAIENIAAPLAISGITSESCEPSQDSILPSTEKETVPLTFSSISSEHFEPSRDVPAPLTFSDITSEDVEPEAPLPSEKLLSFSSIKSEHFEPSQDEASETIETKPDQFTFSAISSQHFEPSEPESPVIPEIVQQQVHEVLAQPTPKPVPEPLAFSSIQYTCIEPIEPPSPEPRSPRRDAVIIPRDGSIDEPRPEPQTPTGGNFIGSVFGLRKGRSNAPPVIAEDDTRQSPSDSPLAETPESQRPLQELKSNSQDRAAKKPKVATTDGSVQTSLTAEQIEEMLRPKSATVPSVIGPVALNTKKSQESMNSVIHNKPNTTNAVDAATIKRPGSSTSGRNDSMSGPRPPLPTDHKQAIAAAAQRSGSSGAGSMGPPLMTAAAYRAANPAFRPRTPSQPLSPGSVRTGTTPRPMHSSGTAEIQSPSLLRIGTGRSRASSVSSFVSEVDSRFGLRQGMLPAGMEPTTDPRMINAITQTMIGEYLWKYTRKAGRGAMSENRHRRYFWVHPYTRTLYWSDHDPSSASRSEVKAKSVPIEAVRVVTDDNPMPPGLHRKSLVIVTPGRPIKFTATTGQRHETWFNALSYILLRTGEDAVGDSSDVATGALTSEDVAEFNPGYANNGTGVSTARPGPASLSSYNSRTTRNESPARKVPTNPQMASVSTRPSIGTFSRLSSYWKPPKEGVAGTFSSKRSRHSLSNINQGSIYEASEVHDSAEDLREIIEKQDRESDRLENVRACCDGKHDVGHLHTSTRSRTPAPGQASTSSQPQSVRNKSRHSLMRHTE